MANRHMIQLTEIENFAAWTEGEGYFREPTNGKYEVLRLRKDVRGKPLLFYRRARKQAVTVLKEAEPLVQKWRKAQSQTPEQAKYAHTGTGAAKTPHLPI